MLVTSNSSFSDNDFYSYISLVHQNAALCGNESKIKKIVYLMLLSRQVFLNGLEEIRADMAWSYTCPSSCHSGLLNKYL